MPAWYRVIRAAKALQQHPADVAGVPESRHCAVWAHWAIAAEWCESEATAREIKSGR